MEITHAHCHTAWMKKRRGLITHHQQQHHHTHTFTPTPTHTRWPWPKVLSIRQGSLPTLGWTLAFSWQDTSLEQLLHLLQDKSACWLIIKGPHRCCFTLTSTFTTTVIPLSTQAVGVKSCSIQKIYVNIFPSVFQVGFNKLANNVLLKLYNI